MHFQTEAFSVHAVNDPSHQLVNTEDGLWSAVQWLEQQPEVAVDTETSGVKWYRQSRICGVSLGAPDPSGLIRNFYFPCRHQTAEPQIPAAVLMSGCRRILENTRIRKVLHNITFDEHMFKREGLRILGPRRDTMVEGHLWNENAPLALDARAMSDLGDHHAQVYYRMLQAWLARDAKTCGLKKTEYLDRYGYSRVPPHLMAQYAGRDTGYTFRLAQHYDRVGVTSYFKELYQTEMDLSEVIFEMEENGLPVNKAYYHWLARVTWEKKEQLKPQLFKELHWTFNPDSDEELRHVVVNVLKLEKYLYRTTDSGLWAMTAEVLEDLSKHHAGLKTLLKYREYEKISSTYTTSILDHVGDDGMLHGHLKQVGTNTGRLSSEQPNLQNMAGDSDDRAVEYSGKKLEDGGIDPFSVKRGITALSHEWPTLSADYSQIELRVLADRTQDPILLDSYRKGEDVHTRTSLEVFGTDEKAMRRQAKIINFGLVYGMSPMAYAAQAGVSKEQGEIDMEKYFAKYVGIRPARVKFWNECRTRNPPGFVNRFGRCRRVPDLLAHEDWRRERAERQAFGSLIQGEAAMLTKISLVRIHRWQQATGAPIKLRGTIHDSIDFSAERRHMRECSQAVLELMEYYPQFSVPILVDMEYFDTDWSEKKPLPEEPKHVWTVPVAA